MKRWQEQRWILDAIIRTVGVEWDQPRLGYMSAPAGPESAAEFRLVDQRIKKAADIDREFSVAARRREAAAESFKDEGRLIAACESYLIAALLWASPRWPIFEINDRLVELEERMNTCFAKYIEYAPHPIEIATVPLGDKALRAYLHLPRTPADGEQFPCVLSIPGMDNSKENGAAMYSDKLLERGIAVLALDGPGQGESCTRGILVTESNYMDAAVAAIDWLWRALVTYREFTVAAVLYDPENVTLPVVVWAFWTGGDIGPAAAVTIVMLAVMTPLIMIYWILVGRRHLVG